MTGLFYQFPPSTDRYIDLMQETSEFKKSSKQIGLSLVIAFGAYEIGMESLILRLAGNIHSKVYMSDEQREFLECMESGNDPDTPVQKLRKICVNVPELAFIHVLPVEEISMEVRLTM